VSTDDDKRAVERFIAGLAADERALAAAISARAVDRAIVVEALLGALGCPVAATRLSAAQRVARMACIAPPVTARLASIAVEDGDGTVRAACAAALHDHGLPMPG
jgi:hypothetical protein